MNSPIKKGINIWSFPSDMSIMDCMHLARRAGFAGIELALSLDGELGLDTRDEDIQRIRADADRIGLEISSLATGLFWQFSITSDHPHIREKAKDVIRREIEIAVLLGVDCVLVCPGAVGVDFAPDEVVTDVRHIEHYVGSEIIDYDVAYERARTALAEVAPFAEQNQVTIGIENIWNKFLLSPLEMRRFIDEIGSPRVQCYFDVGNVVLYGYPQQWMRILGSRIKCIHFKDFRKGTDQLSGFVDLLSGDVPWDEVAVALRQISYSGWINAEMCPPYKHFPEQNIYTASAAMDRILGCGWN